MQWYRVQLTQALQGQPVCWILGHYSGLVKMMPWAMSNVLAWALFLWAQVHKKGEWMHLPCSTGAVLGCWVQAWRLCQQGQGRQLPSVVSLAPEMRDKWNASEKLIPKSVPNPWLCEPWQMNLTGNWEAEESPAWQCWLLSLSCPKGAPF